MHTITPGLKVKLEGVRKLLRRNAKQPLEKMLTKIHEADIATIYKNLNDLEKGKLWLFLNNMQISAKILIHLDDHEIVALVDDKKAEEIAKLLEDIESDDASAILRLLPDETAHDILKLMTKEEINEVEQLLTYAEDTAGSIMNTSYFSMYEETTVKEATKILHKAEDVDMVFYLYVTDEDGKLAGVISLRQLILNTPDTKLKDIMTREVIHVRTTIDQEDVAKIVEKYDILAVPVVDEHNVLEGIITVDDIIDIIREEATEDIYRMAGTSDDELMYGHNSMKIAKIRLPWILVTFFGSLFSGYVITYFEGRITQFALLIAFIPIIMAMGGNVGSQSATILIRGVSLGKVDKKDIFKVIFKEVRVGMIMGSVCGILISGIAYFWHSDPILGGIVGVAMFMAITFASLSGTFVPAMFIKLNLDPAVASSPLITTINDLTGLTIYFAISMTLMKFML